MERADYRAIARITEEIEARLFGEEQHPVSPVNSGL